MKYVKITIIFFISCMSFKSTAQESYSNFSGYVKFMQTLAFTQDNELLIDNLVHNRLNYSYETGQGSKFVAQVRNRAFYGASVKNIPNYGSSVTQYDGVLPLEFKIIDNQNIVVNSIIDRMYYQYANDKTQFIVGRQRINWGINTSWNPNDLFNSYSIYDFDYEEREGSDAIRVKFFPNYMSSIDVAYKFTGNWKNDVVAGMYKFNKWNYDLQMLIGKFQEKIALGTGWAGNLKSLGFKGELTYFQPYNFTDTANLSTSTSLEYSLKNGTFLSAAYLFNSSGTNDLINPNTAIFEVPNAEYLMPAKHNTMLNATYMVTPILNTSLGALYSFGVNNLTLFPTLSLSLKTNLDLDLFGQFFWQELEDAPFQNIGNGIFWRLKSNF